MIKDWSNFYFWVEWNHLNQLKNDDLLATCHFWSTEIWTECIKLWHYGKSCHEEIEEKYNEWALGKSLQLCPKWGSFMEKAQQWNHLTCNRCMSRFCIYCRKKFGENHLNPLNSKACPSLVNNQRSKPIFNSPCLQANIIKLIFLIIIYLLFMPLIIPIFWPIISWK